MEEFFEKFSWQTVAIIAIVAIVVGILIYNEDENTHDLQVTIVKQCAGQTDRTACVDQLVKGIIATK